MGDIKNTCFVCKKVITLDAAKINKIVNMPVCNDCQGTESEKKEEKEVLNSLADGLICGCI